MSVIGQGQNVPSNGAAIQINGGSVVINIYQAPPEIDIDNEENE